jgi:hypothetical protein
MDLKRAFIQQTAEISEIFGSRFPIMVSTYILFFAKLIAGETG